MDNSFVEILQTLFPEAASLKQEHADLIMEITNLQTAMSNLKNKITVFLSEDDFGDGL